ncbi:hypothetical protein CONPUDRAFT_31502, partial [Coniophora puteana RWD-64-598 SS2]
MPSPSQEEAWKKLADVCVRAALYDSSDRQPFSQCLPGTRTSLLETLRESVQREQSNLIFLTGESGSGKSAVAHTFAQEHRENELAATFFFSRQHPGRRNTDHFLPTISYQLGLLHHLAQETITRAITRDPSLL